MGIFRAVRDARPAPSPQRAVHFTLLCVANTRMYVQKAEKEREREALKNLADLVHLLRSKKLSLLIHIGHV